MTATVLRFAPSPNGPLHLGHALSALINHDIARATGGTLLLRIEDIDRERSSLAHEEAIYRDLDWLGVDWQRPARRQSEHFDAYRLLLERLRRDDLVYPAFMSRGEASAWIAEAEAGGRSWPRDPDGVPHYPPRDRGMAASERRRRMAAGEPYSWRLDMARAVEAAGAPLEWTAFAAGDPSRVSTVTARPEAWGDVMLARRDTPTSYHLSVIADDAVQAVTHVVRGLDLERATDVHRLLQQLLGLPRPAYHHHRLVLGPDGRKLSKSRGDLGLAALREAGRTAEDVRRLVGLD